MIHAFNSAVSGALSHEEMLTVLANNLANSNTTGYKSQQTGFSDVLYSNADGSDDLKVGNGVKLSGVYNTFSQGSLKSTGRTLDVAIEGDGYFCVREADGSLAYTRDGSFSISDGFLVNANGNYVLNENLNSIYIREGQDVTFATTGGNFNSVVTLGIFTFKNPYALTLSGNNMLAANENSGQATRSIDVKLKQGCLESSSVDMVSEMTNMISAQRGYQINIKMIQTADEMEQTINNLW